MSGIPEVMRAAEIGRQAAEKFIASVPPKPLSVRMREAADVLEEASELYRAAEPVAYAWSAEDLRREAKHVESEDE